LPIEQRIAEILYRIVDESVDDEREDCSEAALGGKDKLSLAALSYADDTLGGPEDLLKIAAELAKYADKKFCVRYGHLEDGNAKA
jgi:hypothetical protein